MEDHFSELIIPRKKRGSDTLIKALLIAATVVAAFFGLLVSPIFLIALVALGVADYFLFPRFNVEYEYSYVNGEIDVAAVYSKQSRKELASITLENVECIAPAGSHRLDGFGSTFKTIDYSSGDPDAKPYVLVKGGTENCRYLLQLDDNMIEDLRWRLPGKFFRD